MGGDPQILSFRDIGQIRPDNTISVDMLLEEAVLWKQIQLKLGIIKMKVL